jgi:hypothetical protein
VTGRPGYRRRRDEPVVARACDQDHEHRREDGDGSVGERSPRAALTHVIHGEPPRVIPPLVLGAVALVLFVAVGAGARD